MTEDGIADLFERAVRDLDPPVHAIVIRAEQRGRRLRARRRAWMAVGSLVVAALAGTSLTAGVSLVHPRSAPGSAGAASRAAGTNHAGTSPASATASPRSASPRSRGSKQAPGHLMTRKQMLRVLQRLLPAGSTVSNVNPYSSVGGTLELDYNDGRGAVDFMISAWPTTSFEGPLTCPNPLWPNEAARPAGALPESCAMRTLPDGSIERDAVYNTDVKSWYAYSVYNQRPDGVTVVIQVGNGIIHDWPEADRARPPGSMATWEVIAENPAWHL
jgi:hypothetical protein